MAIEALGRACREPCGKAQEAGRDVDDGSSAAHYRGAVNLPSDLSPASTGLDELDELTAFVQATALAESGRTHFTRDDLHRRFTAPGFDVARDVVIVRDPSGSLVGVEWVAASAPFVRFDATGFVSPERLGEGIGTALLGWARELVLSRIDQAPDGARVILSAGVDSRHRPSIDLMTGSGMTQVREFLEMRVDFDGPTDSPAIPEGIEIRGFVPGNDDVATYEAIDEAFRDHFGHVERPLEAGLERFRHWMSSPDYDPTLWWVAVDGDEIAGNCLCEGSVEGDDAIGYVANLGVRRPWRGRGLAKAMLLLAFAEFRSRGKIACTLHVDATNLTGATRLYEAVGMHESERYLAFEAELRSGEDLIVR
jgi:mycothiol synthase